MNRTTQISMLPIGMTVYEKAIERIKTFEPPEGYWLGFSGGKDSIVCYDLLKRAGVKFEAHYSVTGIDHPEVVYFIRREYPSVQFDYPRRKDGTVYTMWNLIVEKGTPPTRLSRYCCDALKEGGGTWKICSHGCKMGGIKST